MGIAEFFPDRFQKRVSVIIVSHAHRPIYPKNAGGAAERAGYCRAYAKPGNRQRAFSARTDGSGCRRGAAVTGENWSVSRRAGVAARNRFRWQAKSFAGA